MELINKVLEVVDLALKADKSGKEINTVDLKCVDSFLSSTVLSMKIIKNDMESVLSKGLNRKIDWTKDTLSKVYCEQCR